MRPPRYFLAKYIPDLGRMEPRNIGVVAWTPGAVGARFLAEKPDRPGDLDGRSIPPFVNSDEAYRQWITFWRAELDRSEIEPIRGGDPVSRNAPEFLDVLATSSRGNFVLAEAGHLLDPVGPDELPSLLDHLFASYVATHEEKPRDLSLKQLCHKLIRSVGLTHDEHFKPNFPVRYTEPYQPPQTFEFSYAYGNGKPVALYERLSLANSERILKKNVHDSAWKFSRVIESKMVSHEHSGVLVMATPEQQQAPEVQEAFDVLNSVTRVLNLTDFETVRAEFSRLPSLLNH